MDLPTTKRKKDVVPLEGFLCFFNFFTEFLIHFEKECFRNFTSVEILEDFKCNNCKQPGCTKQILFEKFPKVLCIVLKRFAYTSRGREKVNTPVEFPLQIKFLKKFCNPNSISEPIKSYSLKSLIAHQGKIATVGHYTAYSFNSAKGFFLFNFLRRIFF